MSLSSLRATFCHPSPLAPDGLGRPFRTARRSVFCSVFGEKLGVVEQPPGVRVCLAHCSSLCFFFVCLNLAVLSLKFFLFLFQMMIVFVLLGLLLQADAQCATPLYSNTAAGTLTTDTGVGGPRLGLKFTSSVDGCLQGVRFNLVGVNATNSSNVTVEASCVCAVLCSLTA